MKAACLGRHVSCGSHFKEILSIIVEMTRWQECVTSIVMKQKQAIFSFVFSLGPQHIELTHIQGGLLTSVSKF